MLPSAVLAGRTVRPRRRTIRGRRFPTRDAAFVVSALLVVAVASQAAASPSTALAAVVLVTVTIAIHARLAKGVSCAVALMLASAGLLAVFAPSLRLAGVAPVTGIVAAIAVGRVTHRVALVRLGAGLGGLAALVSTVGAVAAGPPSAGAVLRDAVSAAAGGVLSGPLVLAFGPFAEWAFGHTTRLTMAEWLDYERPLLRELASAAPGTFQHSVNVGVLADAAAGAIGADALLARIGGLYHDVGKMRAPDYFIENQRESNPHDLLPPRESAAVLRAHVSDGVDLVLAHGLGERLADFVREHHGTGVMRFFRDRALALGDRDASDAAFRYPGPRPRSRETGLVMIADQLEAIARAAPPENEGAWLELVRQTIDRIRAEGELASARLSERDLAAVEPALVRALRAMYHTRVPYPVAGSTPKRDSRLAVLIRGWSRRAPADREPLRVRRDRTE